MGYILALLARGQKIRVSDYGEVVDHLGEVQAHLVEVDAHLVEVEARGRSGGSSVVTADCFPAVLCLNAFDKDDTLPFILRLFFGVEELWRPLYSEPDDTPRAAAAAGLLRPPPLHHLRLYPSFLRLPHW